MVVFSPISKCRDATLLVKGTYACREMVLLMLNTPLGCDRRKPMCRRVRYAQDLIDASGQVG